MTLWQKAFSWAAQWVTKMSGSPSGALRFNPTGGPVLATGGTGDILTGVVAALVGQKVPAAYVLPLAAFLHGLAGDLLAESIGEVGVIATDLLDTLPRVFQAALDGWSGPDGNFWDSDFEEFEALELD